MPVRPSRRTPPGDRSRHTPCQGRIKGAPMSDYNVSLVHTLRIVGVATVTADSEEAALAQMQQRATDGRLGRVEWRIAEDQSGVDEWYEHEVQLTIETVTEDEREPVADMGAGVGPLPCTAASRPAY